MNSKHSNRGKYIRTKRHREIASLRMKNRLTKNISKSVVKNWKNKKRRDAVSKALKKLFKNKEFRNEQSERMRGFIKNKWKDPKYRKIQSLRMKRLWRQKWFKEKMSKIKSPSKYALSRTKPEIELHNRLRDYRIWHRTQYKIILPNAYTVVDAYIPSIKLCIYTDGKYWHKVIPGQIKSDRRKRTSLRKLGYSVFTIDQSKPFKSEFKRLINHCLKIA